MEFYSYYFDVGNSTKKQLLKLNQNMKLLNKNRSLFLQHLIVIRKSSRCFLWDATSERDPKWHV